MAKGTWAYNNGKRIMREVMNKQKPEAEGWKMSRLGECWAEKGNIKTYANKTQCTKKIDELAARGIMGEMSGRHPFVIMKAEKA